MAIVAESEVWTVGESCETWVEPARRTHDLAVLELSLEHAIELETSREMVRREAMVSEAIGSDDSTPDQLNVCRDGTGPTRRATADRYHYYDARNSRRCGDAIMQWSSTLNPLLVGDDLTREQAHHAMTEIMAGRATPAQIAAFIVAIRIKGETIEELTGLVEAMREASVRVSVDRPVLDIVGTGGDGFGTFNISTTAAFIAAGAGCSVAKHGNRSASSKCGSADVLEALGVVIDLEPAQTVLLIEQEGFGFFYARSYHPAMRHAGPVRSELGIPTVFNFLGPLTNPATAEYLALGVSDPAMGERMIGVLANLGAVRAFVCHGDDGLDELSTTGPSTVYELDGGVVRRSVFDPADCGLARAKLDDLIGGDAAENAAILRSVLAGQAGPQRDIAVLNAAAGIAAAGKAPTIAAGIPLAEASIDSGAASRVLERVVALSQELAH